MYYSKYFFPLDHFQRQAKLVKREKDRVSNMRQLGAVKVSNDIILDVIQRNIQ